MRPTRALVLLALVPVLAQAEPVAVRNLRMWQAPDNTRLVFDLSAPLEHRLFTLKEPERVVVDMENAQLLGSLPALEPGDPVIAALRSGSQGEGRLRVVLDLKQAVRPRTFVLKPYGQYGHRLVIDLEPLSVASETDDTRTTRLPRPQGKPRDWVIAIDPGHGGEDPGAIGRRYRTHEKDVVLAIARELEKRVAAAPGMRAVMTRDGDYYVSLKRRYEKARAHEADLFVSIHADALPGRKARGAQGASVYALSERGASSVQAQALADKENAADLIGGVSLNDKDDLLFKVLLDLSQTATIGSSLKLGAGVLRELAQVGPVHLSSVQQAGFAVLKAPDVPSILIETAFISNPAEEKKLRSRGYQRAVGAALFQGIERFLAGRERPRQSGSVVASPAGRTHVVQVGETLATIARTYGIHEEALRFANRLAGSQLSVGTTLIIP